MGIITKTREQSVSTLSSDAELLSAFAREHDEAAFATLLRRHGPLILGVCRRALRNADDADDAFQATFLALAMKAKKEPPRHLPAWLHRVAVRTSLAMKSRTARQSAIERMLMRFGRINTISRPANIEARLVLDEQINLLPQRYRDVVVHCFLGGKSKSEAAIELGCPEGTVSSRLHHARELLRRRLQRLGFGGEDMATSLSSMGAVSVPTLLASSTVQAAHAVVTGKVAAGAVSAMVLKVADAAARPVLFSKANIAIAVVLVAATVIAVPVSISHVPGRAPVTESLSANAKNSGTAGNAVANSAAAKTSATLHRDIHTSARDSDKSEADPGKDFFPANDAGASGRLPARRFAAATRAERPAILQRIDGRVIDIGGSPVPRAWVFASPTLDNAVGRNGEKRARADTQGNFELPGCSGDYLLHAFALDRSVTRTAVGASAGDHVKLQVAPNAAPVISGHVTDSDRNPIYIERPLGFGSPRPGTEVLKKQSGVLVDVLIELTPNSGDFRAMHWTPDRDMADEAGDFSVTGFFPDARFRVAILAHGYRRYESDIQKAANGAIAIELPEVILKQE